MAITEILVNTDVPYRRAAQFLEESVDRLGLGFVLKNADTSIREGQNPTEALLEFAEYYEPEYVAIYGQHLLEKGWVYAVDVALCVVYSSLRVYDTTKNDMLKIKYSKLGEDFADYALLTIQPPSPVIKERLNYFLEARQL